MRLHAALQTGPILINFARNISLAPVLVFLILSSTVVILILMVSQYTCTCKWHFIKCSCKAHVRVDDTL